MDTLLTPTFTALLVLLELCCLALIILNFAVIARNYATLPPTVPMHFGINGVPDSWQGKAMLWLLPATTIFLFLLLTGSALMIPLNPQGYHGLAHPLTPELLGQLNRATVLMVELLKVQVVGMFLYLTHKILNVACGKEQRLNTWGMLLFLVSIFATIGLFILYLKDVLHV